MARARILAPALIAGLSLLGSDALAAERAMVYVYNAPESSLDQRYVYQWAILRTALERTKQKWGPYVMQASEPMTEQRQAFELLNHTGKLTVMYLGTKPEFEKNLVGVHIPVDKNLGGYSVFLIRREDEGKFASVHTLADLKPFRFGLGLGWIDVDILRWNGLDVETGSSYDGLFEMLVQRRFDILLRAAVEVLDEFDERVRTMPDLMIEKRFILYYPLPMYFWFARTDEGRKLAKRAEEGMRSMIADGTYDRIFNAYQGSKIERLHLKDRTIISIRNPFLGPETPFSDKRLWFDPKR